MENTHLANIISMRPRGFLLKTLRTHKQSFWQWLKVTINQYQYLIGVSTRTRADGDKSKVSRSFLSKCIHVYMIVIRMSMFIDSLIHFFHLIPTTCTYSSMQIVLNTSTLQYLGLTVATWFQYHLLVLQYYSRHIEALLPTVMQVHQSRFLLISHLQHSARHHLDPSSMLFTFSSLASSRITLSFSCFSTTKRT